MYFSKQAFRSYSRFLSSTSKILASALLLSVFIVSSASAQGRGNIKGRVLDQSDKSSLWGANVLVKGSVTGATTNDEGRFILNNLPAGKTTLTFRYIGYSTIEKEVTVLEGQTVNVEVELKSTSVEGVEIVVTGQRQGQQAAINQQLSSNSIVNIVAKDRIQELPDQNAAETLARLPGISLERNGGEGQKVIIRGLSPKYNNITINGEKIPSTDEMDRSVDLSSISPDMLAGIEVYKSLTADKDGDAVGGTVNFTVKKAPEGMHSDFKLQGGYGSQEKYYGNYRGSLSLSNRYLDNLLGLVLTGNMQRADRSSDAQDVSYSYAGESNGHSLVNVGNLNLNDIKEKRDRYGASLALDYDLGNGGLFFSGFWSQTKREQIERRKRYQISIGRTQYEFMEQNIDLQLLSTSLDGNYILGPFQVDWKAAFSQSDQNIPHKFNNIFQELSSLQPGIILNQGPEMIPLGVKDDLSKTTFKESDDITSKVLDKSVTFQLNSKVNFDFGNDIAGYIKFGGKAKFNSRMRDNTNYWTSSFNIDYLGTYYSNNPGSLYRNFSLTGDRKILMSNFLSSENQVGSFLGGRYNFGPTIDQALLDDFLAHQRNQAYNATGKPLYELDPRTDLEDYNASENIMAAYAMSELNVTPQLLFVPGIRLERTYNDYKSIFGKPSQDEDAPNVIGAQDTVGSSSYYDFLPMVQMKYKLADWFDFRAAVTKTISRPNYFDLVPYQDVSYRDNYVKKGNPSLKHTRVWSYDLNLSVFNEYGLFTVGGFYKKLWDVDYLRTSRIEEDGKYHGMMLYQAVNAESPSTVYGTEIDIQANMTLLPSPFDGIVFYANLSLMKSKTYFPLFQIGPRSPLPPYQPTIIDTVREGSMPGQADFMGNVAVGYEKGGFSGRLSVILQGKSLAVVGPTAELDGYTDKSIRFDVSLSQKLFEGFSFFLNANNLTDLPERSFLGAESFPTKEEYYGWTLDVGVKYKF
ncbi:MAG: TonB-dependent receptor [Acidobacteriota bacterium]